MWVLRTAGHSDVQLAVEHDDFISESDADRLLEHLGYEPPKGGWPGNFRTYRSRRPAVTSPYNECPGVQINRFACPGLDHLRVSIRAVQRATQPLIDSDITWLG